MLFLREDARTHRLVHGHGDRVGRLNKVGKRSGDSSRCAWARAELKKKK